MFYVISILGGSAITIIASLVIVAIIKRRDTEVYKKFSNNAKRY